ncbi:MAG: hypothetical protein IJ659_01005 [Alloprevotella sp.]|nr:hypothetical protein [Alloprevotella sp.]
MTRHSFQSLLSVLLAPFVLAACHVGRPDTNGSTHQPVEHGWTFEQAGEFWLRSALDTERNAVVQDGADWMTAEQLAALDDEHIQVKLPLAPEGTDPMPRDGISYRQASTGGTITFHLDSRRLSADTLHAAALRAAACTAERLGTVGTADVWLKEPLYFPQDTVQTCYVQRRGRGIYTLYYIADPGTRAYPHGRMQSVGAVVSVPAGADSLTVCRGNMLGGNYIAQ